MVPPKEPPTRLSPYTSATKWFLSTWSIFYKREPEDIVSFPWKMNVPSSCSKMRALIGELDRLREVLIFNRKRALVWRQLGSNVRRGDRGGYCRPRPRFRGSLSRMDGGDYLPILSHLCCILKIFRFIKTIGVAISDLQILLPLILTSLLPPMGGQPQW